MTDSLSQSIISTLSYFDQFDYPLTAEELYRFLWQPLVNLTYPDFLVQLEIISKEQVCENTLGYYHLSGRSSISEDRRRCLVFVEEKMVIARKAARLLANVPFVKAMYACNTVAAGWPTEKSDIDVFIVVKFGRLWLTRILVTGLIAVANLRRGKQRITDLICLSFYGTDKHLNVSSVAIAAPDIYLIYWLQQLVPVYDDGLITQRLYQENSWAQVYLPNGFLNKEMLLGSLPSVSLIARSIRHFFEWLLKGTIGDWIERLARSRQIKRIERQPHAAPPAVVISDTMLKFHESDRRAEFQAAWLERCRKYVQ